MTTPSRMNCPTCGRRFLSDETQALPFCSQRCQLIDLGRWLNEEISLPHETGPEESIEDFRDPDGENPSYR